MPAETPTKSAPTLPAEAAEKKFDRYHPEMPHIPGVADTAHRSAPRPFAAEKKPFLQIVGAVTVAAAIALMIFLWIRRAPVKTADSSAMEITPVDSPVPKPPDATPTPLPSAGPGAVATLEELSKPWSAKKFVIAKPTTGENVNAIVIRLPGGGFWAFSLQEPYGQCELEFITNVSELSTKYGYRATHPMVVNPCNRTVYDPLKVGPLGANTWARGEIVQGGGLRPPLSIDVAVKGHSVIANQME